MAKTSVSYHFDSQIVMLLTLNLPFYMLVQMFN